MIRVIYVDDEEDLLEIGKVFLEKTGDLKVDTAASVAEADKKMSRSRYDVIISDYQMPEINGLQYLKMIRQKDRSIPFILFTGRGREEVVIEAVNSGVSAYVQKGGHPDAQFVELEHKIKHWVDKRNADDALLIKKRQAVMAMDLARVASWEYDERSRLFRFDDIFYQLLGTDASTESGYFMSPEKYVGEFVHPDDVLAVIDYMLNGSKGIPAEAFGQIEHRFVTRSGEVRNFLVRIGWIKDENGDPLTTYGVNYDITDVKRSGNAVTNRIEGLEYPER